MALEQDIFIRIAPGPIGQKLYGHGPGSFNLDGFKTNSLTLMVLVQDLLIQMDPRPRSQNLDPSGARPVDPGGSKAKKPKSGYFQTINLAPWGLDREVNSERLHFSC